MISEAQRVLVIGHGSIGSRHAVLLRELECDVAVVSRRAASLSMPQVHDSLAQALEQHRPHRVVIANETRAHAATLEALANLDFQGHVLCEKPLLSCAAPLPAHRFASLKVAYNLRFHPVLQALAGALDGQRVISAHGYAGQYLPDWRPGTDYRTSYSASAIQGGGVLLDLSHELDALHMLFGPWTSVVALGGQWSPLELSSDDVFALLMQYPGCPAVSLQLNYLDRRARRNLIVNTDAHTYEADLVRHVLVQDKDERVMTIDRNHTYRSMHSAWLRNETALCNLEAALSTVRLVDAARQSTAEHAWIHA